MNDAVSIQSRDYWFKVEGMLQQNWAPVDAVDRAVVAYFLSDASGVFDQLSFAYTAQAGTALRLNGFGRFADDPDATSFLHSRGVGGKHLHLEILRGIEIALSPRQEQRQIAEELGDLLAVTDKLHAKHASATGAATKLLGIVVAELAARPK